MNRVHPLVWAFIATVILIGAGVWFFTKNQTLSGSGDSDQPARVSKSVEGVEEFEIIGREHIAQDTAGSGYNSNPPTSCVHWASPARNGVHDEVLSDERLIHNLEHGHVWLTYKPDIDGQIKEELKKIVENDDWKVVMAPRDKNDTKIALVAWGRVLRLDTPDYDKVRDFIKTYRNRGPEKTPD